MPETDDTAGISASRQFRLLLWLKFRLTWGASKQNRSSVIGYILMAVIFGPISIMIAWFGYHFAADRPEFAPTILRDTLAAAYFFWIATPLFGFSMNESYDPTRLFAFPVRYQTMFAANVVGSLFEMSTILFMPILIALILVVTSNPLAIIVSILILLVFMLHTIALGQALSLMLIGFLRSRRFRDIMIVLIPLIALLARLFQYSIHSGTFQQMFNSPLWLIASFLPPGWAATALSSVGSGEWLSVAGCAVLLIAALLVTTLGAAFVMKQLFTGERGTSLAAAKKQIAEAKPEQAQITAVDENKGSWGPTFALVQKEWRYLLRDPQYKALATNAIYFMGIYFFSIFRGHAGQAFTSLASSDNSLSNIIRDAVPVGFCAFVLLFTMQLTFNIFGGEGPAVTMLFSFPVPRRQIVISKNIAYGSVVVLLEIIGGSIAAIVIGDIAMLPLTLVWIIMATLVMLAAGNLVSVKFPTKLVTRAGRLNRGGQLTTSQRNFGSGCAYMLMYLLFAAAAFAAEIPVVGAILMPAIGWISPMWYFALIPFGIIYSLGLYYMSMKIIDVWMIAQETNIIAKLTPTE